MEHDICPGTGAQKRWLQTDRSRQSRTRPAGGSSLGAGWWAGCGPAAPHRFERCPQSTVKVTRPWPLNSPFVTILPSFLSATFLLWGVTTTLRQACDTALEATALPSVAEKPQLSLARCTRHTLPHDILG